MEYGMCAWWKICSVVPISTSFPAYMTPTRSACPATTPRSCVIRTTAAPVRSFACSSTSRICAWIVTSSAVVGSSAMITLGSFAIAIAIMARWRMPPEYSCGNARARRAASGMPTTLSSSTARACAACSESFESCTRRASLICCPTEYTGVSADSGSWNTMASSLPRTRDSWASFISSSDRPSNSIAPRISAVEGSRPMTASDDTDLPDPDSPTIPRNSPG